jgi:NACalpha-BTF3-like transcription factor
MAKRNEIAKKAVDVDNGTVTFTFADSGAPIVVELSKVSVANQNRLALHGMSQKCGDSYAGAESIPDAREAVLGVQEMLYSGEWSTRAPGEPRVAVLAEALARATGRTVEDAKVALAAMDEDTRKAVSAHPGVKKARAEMALEKANAELAAAPALTF